MVTTPNFDLDIDTTLGGSNASDYIIPSQKAIKSYVDNNSGSTVDQTFDGTSANAQSGVAIAGAKFLQNTATATNSLTILGTTNNQNNSILIGYSTTTSSTNSTVIGNTAVSGGSYATAYGYYARANAQYTTAIGHNSYANYQDVTAVGHSSQATAAGTLAVGSNSQATSQRATAIGYSSTATQYAATSLGYEAKATANSALQIGTGTNSTANTLQVGTYTLLDTSTGLIPDARISSNIARTTAIPTVNNPTITFTQGGTTKGTITLNQSTNQTIALDAGGGGGTVDQTFDGTSANAQSGVAIAGELANYVKADNNPTYIYNNGSDFSCGYDDGTDYKAELFTDGNVISLYSENYNTGYNSFIDVSSEVISLNYSSSANGGIEILNVDGNLALLTVTNDNNLAVNGSEVALQSDIPDISTKQDTLVSGTNIKTINNTSLLGSGNIDTSEIFIAEYGSTTLNELNEAYNAGKEIFCYYQTLLCNPYSFVSGGTSSAGYCFVGITNNQSINITFTGSRGWDVSTVNLAKTDLSNLSATGKTVIDGQWVMLSSAEVLLSGASIKNSSATPLPKTVTLPDDNYVYEVMIRGSVTTGTTNGNYIELMCTSNQCSETVFVCSARTRSSSNVVAQGTVIIPMKHGTDNLSIIRDANYNGTANMAVIGYRRIGTNT